jgi:hypothetical protein
LGAFKRERAKGGPDPVSGWAWVSGHTKSRTQRVIEPVHGQAENSEPEGDVFEGGHDGVEGFEEGRYRGFYSLKNHEELGHGNLLPALAPRGLG